MPKVRGNGSARWAQRTAAATADYQAGVASPRVSWAGATVAAKDAHKQGIMQALATDAFAKGVQKAGDAKWSAAAQGKGAERFGPGAAAGQSDYQAGVSKYLQVIESTVLPPRGPKGDPRNINRVAVLAAALRKAKTGSALLAVLGLVGALGLMFGALCATLGAKGLCPSAHPAIGQKCSQDPAKVGVGSWWGLAVALAAMKKGLVGAACLDIITITATAPGAGGAAGAAAPGDSLQVRNCDPASPPILLNWWAFNQVVGFGQITHPSGNDAVRDIRAQVQAATVLPLFALGIAEPFQPQELIGSTIAGSAVGGQVEINCLQMYYPSLPGTDARLIDVDTMMNRAINQVTVADSTTATVGGSYGGPRALNAGSDLLRANTDYALLGAHIGANCAALTVRGSDSANLRVSIPGVQARPDLTATWFVNLTEQFGLPLIPVFNSANKAGILIENVTNQALVAVPFSLVLVQLSPG